MAARPRLIYCAGGNRQFMEIAVSHGFLPGARLPDTVYFRPLAFADQDWRAPNRGRYMAALREERPVMASVLDWEREEQLSEVLEWAEEAAPYVEQVMVIPKVVGGIERLPREVGGRQVVLGYSVPTKHGATPVPFWEFGGWPVHLLGGSPHRQMREWCYLSCCSEVVSADGNMAQKMAVQRAAYWATERGVKGNWHQLKDGEGDAPVRAFRRSCENIIQAWARLGVA
jgi:hypothetical protein